jgi:YfiR/HmsC-like
VRHLWRIPRGLGAWLVVAVSVALCGPEAAEAQTATAPALKAAYLYNFAKFTTWPGEALAPAEPLVLCVLNDRAVNDGLASLALDRSIEGHALVVRATKLDSPTLNACRILFVAGLDAPGSAALLDKLAGKPILTVSDLDGFAQSGGIAGFYVEGGTLKFAINLDATQRAGLHLSSKMLSLARIIKEDRRAIRR